MALGRPEAVNASFSLAPSDAAALGASDWDDQFLKLVGPELLRRPLRNGLSASEGRTWLREGQERTWCTPTPCTFHAVHC